MSNIKNDEVSNLSKILNDESFSKRIIKSISEMIPIDFTEGNTTESTLIKGYWVQCHCESKNYNKFWSNLISYMTITYDLISIETYNRNATVINNINEIGWDYKFISNDEIVALNGSLTDEIKNYVANNCITSKMKLIWFCIKLRNKDSVNELIILPVYSRKERITITIHIVNENQLIFLKSLFGEDIFIRKR